MAGEGILQFVLGLETGGFITNLGAARAEENRFMQSSQGAAAGVGNLGSSMAMAGPEFMILAVAVAAAGGGMIEFAKGIESAIGAGTGLEHLSKQTGETVSDLYKLQEGFKAVGLDAGQLPNMLIRMDQALSGIGRGATATPILRRMGLDPESLKQMGAAQQIDTIATALSKLDKQSAAGAASQLFGMETGAQPFLQVVGSANEFHAAMNAANDDAQNFTRNAAGFAKLDATIISIKGHLEGFFAGAAGGLVPMLQDGLDVLDKMDGTLLHIGSNIGNMFRGIGEAFKEGHLEDLIGAAFDAGVERLGTILFSPAFWQGFSDAMIGGIGGGMMFFAKMILNMGVLLKSVLDEAFQQLFAALGKIPKIGHFLGLDNFTPDSFSQVFQRNQQGNQFANDYLSKAGNFGAGMFKDGLQELGKAIAASGNGPAEQKFDALVQGLTAKAPSGAGDLPGATGAAKSVDNLAQQHYKPEATDLEKMGFVMTGIGTAFQDRQLSLLERIATNTMPKTAGSADPTAGLTNAV